MNLLLTLERFCCRNLRQTCEARGFDKADLGPDEYEMKLSDSEIQSAHMKELDRVKSELARTKNETDTLKMRVSLRSSGKTRQNLCQWG